MKELNIYGCSFSEMLVYVKDIFTKNFEFKNYGKISANNFYIFNKFKETSTQDSICIIQWSSLTRPMDENFSLLKTSDNPLYDLLEQWYELLDQTKIIAEERNIDLIQFIGWCEWLDEELNDYHRNKLLSYDIQWFESKEQWDLIESNCFQLQEPSKWTSPKNEQNLFKWKYLKWGGMSEWIRENVSMDKRYTISKNNTIDPHPSFYGLRKFYEIVVISRLIQKSIL
jgi:hypothetical protein